MHDGTKYWHSPCEITSKQFPTRRFFARHLPDFLTLPRQLSNSMPVLTSGHLVININQIINQFIFKMALTQAVHTPI